MLLIGLTHFLHLLTATDLRVLHLVSTWAGFLINQFCTTFFTLVTITCFSGHANILRSLICSFYYNSNCLVTKTIVFTPVDP